MKLFGLLFRFEILHLRRERMMLWTAVFFFGLLSIGVYEGQSAAEKINKEQEMLQKLNDARLNRMNADLNGANWKAMNLTPHEIGGKTAKRYMYKAPQSFAMISVGQSKLFESHYGISLRDPDFTLLSGKDSLENPLLTYLGNFDLAFVIIWLMPLLIILYMYNVLSAESEMGTLNLLRSHPISLSRFIALKSLVKFTLVVGFMVIALLGLFLVFNPAVFQQPVLLGYLLLMFILYALFWFLVSILVNIFRQQSITNLSFLFVVFLAIVLIIPSVAGLVSDYKNPVPSRMALVNTLRETTREIDNDSARLLDAYYFDHPELAPKENVRSMAQYVYKNALKKKLLETAARPIVESYYTQTARQMKAVNGSVYASPAIGMYAGMDALAQNDLATYIHFQMEVDTARLEWRQIFEPKIFRDEMMTPVEIRNLPNPKYTEAYSSQSTYLKSLGGLGVTNILVLILIFINSLKDKARKT